MEIGISIKTKIAVLAGLCLLFTVVILVFFSGRGIEQMTAMVGQSSSETLKQNSLFGMSQASQLQGALVRQRFSNSLVFGQALAQQVLTTRNQAIAHGVPAAALRKDLYDLLAQQVQHNSEVLGVAIVFGRDALDGKDSDFVGSGIEGGNETGRFASYASVSAKSYSMPESELSDDAAPWMTCPQNKGGPCVAEPYSYEGMLMSTVSLPMIQAGKVLGVISIDISLSNLQGLLETASKGIFDGQASVTLISPSGLIAAHSDDASVLGKPFATLLAEHGAQVIAQLSGGQVSSFIENGVLVCAWGFEPVAGAPKWGVVVSVPDAVYMAPAHSLLRQLEDDSRSAITFQTLVGVLIFTISLLLVWLVARSISRPIMVVSAMVENIAGQDGDLTHRLDYARPDELGKLAYWFNSFLDKLQPIITQVGQSVAQTRSTSGLASDIATQTNEGMRQQFLEVDQVATASQEMSATAQDVARNTALAAQAVTDVQRAVSSAGRVAHEAADAFDQLVREIGATETQVVELERNSEQIGNVLDVIRSVAEQTNLLALNAAIEAARAGESGRGFAVVADEVRNLARRTQTSVTEIQDVIQRLQGGTQAVASSMRTNRDEASSSVRHVHLVVGALTEIASGMDAINGMNLQIASAAEEQSAVCEEVNRNVSTIRDVTEQLARRAEESVRISQSLDQLADHQQSLMSTFRV